MGAIAGLVMITPAAGFVDMPTAAGLGVLGAVVCRQALRIKGTAWARRWRWVDNGDTFATHCVGGVLATICTGLFARKEVAAYGGVEIVGGVVFDGNWRQLWVQVSARCQKSRELTLTLQQIVEVIIGFLWSFVGSFVIIALIDCVPGFEVLDIDK
jgi:Amt family ammonium transporter